MDDISGAAVVGLLSMVGFGWVLHVKGEEPGEFVLFISMVLGLFLQAKGPADWVPWLWFGTLILCLGFYAVDWTVGWGRRTPHPTGRHAPKGPE
ncbi:hypothetical protein [Nostocoides sp. Soil756]|jgi:hypothetical protein|uniref:hypothetical protein n=1 Tax=Nostocoides sp. Soil756 TaxID=1736399 RepID=UPI0006F8C84B|nr:hypothetical protein [Tetrasphaera sp. Soil756]KRE62379.1 hypothetical protein ASG78_04905 [Tetrasphaera sp. Soil756]